jgi:CBS domain-containing protein
MRTAASNLPGLIHVETDVKAKDVMSGPAIAVRPDASLREVVRILAERRISGVPVVEGAGRR